MKKIEGLIAAVYPPLDKERKLNLAAIEPYAEFLVKNKVNAHHPTTEPDGLKFSASSASTSALSNSPSSFL